MKIVINNCFGGFGLSVKAKEELFAAGCEHTEEIPYEDGDWIGDETPIHDGKAIIDHHSTCDEYRTCPELVSVVERLGDLVHGEHADLKVVEIPDGVQWTIEDYDGNESVHEVHRSWC